MRNKGRFLSIFTISLCFLMGCGQYHGSETTKRNTEIEKETTTESEIRNQLFDEMVDVNKISWAVCGLEKSYTEDESKIQEIINFLKGLDLEEAEPEVYYGSYTLSFYENSDEIINITYNGQDYFVIGEKSYISKDSNAGNALDTMCRNACTKEE